MDGKATYVLKEVCEEKEKQIDMRISWLEEEMQSMKSKIDKIYYLLIVSLVSLVTNLIIQFLK